MSKDVLRYDLMVQEALKGVVRKILTEAGRDGLPGDHHFYVTFRTTAPGVRVSKKKEPAPLQVLGFTLDELKEARLAPIVDFKGRKRAGAQEQGK